MEKFRIGIGQVEYEPKIGLPIMGHTRDDYAIVVKLANDAIGYIPTQEAFEQGGYEPTAGACNFAPGVGEKSTASALEQLEKLFNN